MAYDEHLALRSENIIGGQKDFIQKKMFGGVGYILKGNLCFGVYKDYLILRLSEENALKALEEENTKSFDITGRPMKGWVMVENNGLSSDNVLRKWINKSIDYVKTLHPKND